MKKIILLPCEEENTYIMYARNGDSWQPVRRRLADTCGRYLGHHCLKMTPCTTANEPIRVININKTYSYHQIFPRLHPQNKRPVTILIQYEFISRNILLMPPQTPPRREVGH